MRQYFELSWKQDPSLPGQVFAHVDAKLYSLGKISHECCERTEFNRALDEMIEDIEGIRRLANQRFAKADEMQLSKCTDNRDSN